MTALNEAVASGFSSVSAGIDGLAAALPSIGSIGALQTAVTNLSADVASRSTQASLDAGAAAAMRVAIERALSNGDRIIWFMLPAAVGGHLELVRQIVDDSIAAMQAIGVSVARSSADFQQGDAAFAAGDYRNAYEWYGRAYQRLRR